MLGLLKALLSGSPEVAKDPQQALAEAERLLERAPSRALSLLRELARRHQGLFETGAPLAPRYAALVRRCRERERGRPEPSVPSLAVIAGRELAHPDLATLWARADRERCELLLFSRAPERDAFAEALVPLFFAEDRALAMIKLDEQGSFVVRRQLLLAMRGGGVDPRSEELGPEIEAWLRRQRLTVVSLG